VAYLLREGQAAKVGTQFLYSKTSSHLVAAVLAAALRRALAETIQAQWWTMCGVAGSGGGGLASTSRSKPFLSSNRSS
jgi:hypothetical protein